MALSETEELELLTLEREKAFASTGGGAATGNPNLRRQGDKQVRSFGGLEPVLDIGGATVLGGVLGGASAEILGGAGRAIGAIPQLRGAGKALEVTGDLVRAGGRAGPAVAGAVSGALSETAGQVAEGAGAGPVMAEGARIAGGLGGSGAYTAGLEVMKKHVITPSFTVLSRFKKEAFKAIIGQIERDGPESLSDAQKKFVQSVTAELRGGSKSDTALEAVGTGMAESADNAAFQAGRAKARADADLSGIGPVTPDVPPAEFSDIGGKLRGVITTRNAKAKEVNDALYRANEEARDKVVSQREAAGDFVNKLPEFKSLVRDLKNSLAPGVRSPDVQKTYQHMLTQLGGAAPEQKKLTFQAIDDVRRSLGEVFRGKPPEGYAAIAADDARKYYAMLSDIQKKYAGDAQERLLDDYARGKERLEPFISARGRKATALDRYDDSQFVTDASALPDTYFKTRDSVRALKQLTGDEKLVTEAAMQYVNKKLDGASASQADKFMRDNADWLRDVPAVRTAVENYGTKRVARERGVAQATAFADEAAANSAAIVGGRFPAERVRNLVQNGNMDLWEKAGPAIASSPQAKTEVLTAVRQVLADKPMSPDQFSRQLRPALKGAGLADDAALDLIQKKLQDIKEMKIPEKERLGAYRRAVLQAVGGYTASGVARGAVEAAKMVPD